MRYIGNVAFEDKCQPMLSKNEYGIDVVTRKMQGAATLLANFIQGLRQGSGLSGYAGFSLQTWTPDDDPLFPIVSLVYKGVLGGNLPAPVGSDDKSIQTVTISTQAPQKASRDVQFFAFQTLWRYVTNARPTGPRVGTTSAAVDPVVISSVIKTEDGKIFFGNAPVGLVSALTPAIINLCTGIRSTPVIGSPYFEVEETIIRTFKGN